MSLYRIKKTGAKWMLYRDLETHLEKMSAYASKAKAMTVADLLAGRDGVVVVEG